MIPAQGNRTVTVRPVREGDVDRLVELGERMHREGAFASLPFDRDKVRQFAARYATGAPGRLGLAAEVDGKVAGMFAGSISEYFFCHEKIACEMVLYVEPEYRGTSAAARMIRAFREWAAGLGAREVCLGTSIELLPEATGRFFEVLGFRRVGAIYKERLR